MISYNLVRAVNGSIEFEQSYSRGAIMPKIKLCGMLWMFAFSAFSVVFGADFAFADPTSLAKLFSISKFDVVTTESAEKLAGMLEALNVNTGSFYTVGSHTSRAMQLSKADVLIIVDRQKAEAELPLLDRLVGIPSGQIESTTVMITSFRRPGGVEGTHIMVTAPDEKRLYNELDVLVTASAYSERFEDTGFRVIRQYNIFPMQVVSNADKQIAADWIASISKPGGDIYDWNYRTLNEFILGSNMPTNMLFVLNTAADMKDAVKPLLPKELTSWLSGSGRKSGQAVMSSPTNANRSESRVYSFAAPGTRHLVSLMSKYADTASIPEKLNITSLNDLGHFKRLGVVVCRKNSSDTVLGGALDVFNDRLVSVLANLGTGITFIPIQDVATVDQWEGKDLGKTSNQVDGFAVLQILDYQGVSTPAVTVFAKAKPRKPIAPDKTDLSYATKLKKYNARLKNYLKQLLAWESEKRTHKKHIMDVAKQWLSQEPISGVASISGNIRVFDNSSQSPSMILELQFTGSANTVNVRNPNINQAFVFACKDMAAKMCASCVFTADISDPKM